MIIMFTNTVLCLLTLKAKLFELNLTCKVQGWQLTTNTPKTHNCLVTCRNIYTPSFRIVTNLQ